MADPTAVPAAPTGDPTKGTDYLQKEVYSGLQQLQDVDKQTDQYSKDFKPKLDDAQAGIDASLKRLREIQAEAPKMKDAPNAPDIKDRKQSLFALMGVIVAGLAAGRASKVSPMLTAAGAMTAYHKAKQEDDAAAQDAALKQWEVENKKIQEYNTNMRQAYADAADLAKTDVTLATQRYNMLNAQYGDGLKDIWSKHQSIQDQMNAADKIIAIKDRAQQASEREYDRQLDRKDREQAQADRRQQFQESLQLRKEDLANRIQNAKNKLGNAKASVAEEKATTNYGSMLQAEQNLEQLEDVDATFLSTVQGEGDGYWENLNRMARNGSLTPQQQMLAQAANQFAEGAGHLKSGARINGTTMSLMQRLYLRMPNDSPEVLAQKKAARKRDIMVARLAGGKLSQQFDAELSGGTAPAAAGTSPPAASADTSGWKAEVVK